MDEQQTEQAVLFVQRAEVSLKMLDITGALKDLQTAADKDPSYVKVFRT
jgi:hypothetical protein